MRISNKNQTKQCTAHLSIKSRQYALLDFRMVAIADAIIVAVWSVFDWIVNHGRLLPSAAGLAPK